MDCMESKAFKSSLRLELASKSSTQQLLFEDYLCFNAGNGVSAEDFSVDDLLDFSNGELQEGDQLSVSSDQDPTADDDNNSNFSNFSAADSDSDTLLANGLSVPVDDVAELEWVSQFVDDSLPDFSPAYGVLNGQTGNYTNTRPEPEFQPAVTRPSCFYSPFPSKARTKRPRIAGRLWMTSLSDSSSTSSEISSSSCLTSTSPVQTGNFSFPGSTEPIQKKQKKKPPVQSTGFSGPVQFQRRCSHCQVQKTPQWRTGPLGAKTLCNACGVRFKSGRLFPEYRPACSPTFSNEVHSNSHRKVLEMRKKKEGIEPDSGLNRIISSF